jgi:hypothetical protein
MNLKFDVIQMVNSHNADSLLSGALSISETYIYTVESFKDYWDHLQPGGFVHILHWNGERLFATALRALREMAVDRPEDRFFIVQYARGFNHFFLKKGDFSPSDYETLEASVGANGRVVYAPNKIEDNLYYRMMDDPEGTRRGSSVNIAPVYDDSPYFNQPNRIGQFRFRNVQIQGMGESIVHYSLVYSNSIYLSILGLSLFFSLFLIYFPLRRRSLGVGQKSLIAYFFFIGLAFIMVEIIFIKVFQLFLGSPALSISIIIFSLLVSSGVGSLFSKRFSRVLGPRLPAFFSVFLTVLLAAYGLGLFWLLDRFIFLPFPWRMAVSFIFISLAGFFMGSFFPDGIRRLGEANKVLIGWAWGANSFATVLGSILAVIASINWDFTVVLILAGIAYLAAGFCSLIAGRKKAA